MGAAAEEMLNRIQGLVRRLVEGMAPLLLSFAVGLFKPSPTAPAPLDWKQRLHNLCYGTDRRKHRRAYKCMVTRMWHPEMCGDGGYVIPCSKASVSFMSFFKHMTFLSQTTASQNSFPKCEVCQLTQHATCFGCLQNLICPRA